MPGVSSRAPVKGADGFGKVYLKFVPKKKRKFSFLAGFLYISFFCAVFFKYAWPRVDLREAILLPVLRRVLGGIEYIGQYRLDAPHVPRDKNGVPFLAGKGLDQVLFHQGYVHAMDRMSQMDCLRRAATGRLSELFGNRTLELDKFAVTLNFQGLAVHDLSQLDQDELGLLQAYANGVNKFLDDSKKDNLASYWTRFPLEYLYWVGVTRNYRYPSYEVWEPLHSLATLRLLSYKWSSGWEQEILRTATNSDESAFAALDSVLPSLRGNAFAVSGRFTKSGAALMASDAHERLSSEGTWYTNALETPAGRVTGVSIPGLPFVLMGRNDRISWSFVPSALGAKDTLVSADATDRRREAVKSLINGTEEFFDISVGQSTLPTELHPLPLMADVFKPKHKAFFGARRPEVLSQSLLSRSLQGTLSLSFLRRLGQARSFQDFEEAWGGYTGAALNVLYADVEGNIGYAITNSDSESGLSSVLNPAAGYVILSSDDLAEVKRTRLEGLLLAGKGRLDAESAQDILLDSFSPSSLVLTGLIEAMTVDPLPAKVAASVTAAQSIVAGFDGHYSANARAPVVLEAFRNALLDVVLGRANHMLSTDLVSGGADISVMRRSGHRRSVGSLEIVASLSNSTVGSSLLSVLGAPKLSAAELAQCVHEAYTWAEKSFGPKTEEWQWGEAHAAVYLHPSVPGFYIFDEVWSRGPSPIGGGVDSIFYSRYVEDSQLIDKKALRHASSEGSTLRMVVEMGNTNRVIVSSAVGLSSNLGSPYYGLDAVQRFGAKTPTEQGSCFHSQCVGKEIRGYCQQGGNAAEFSSACVFEGQKSEL